MTVVRQEPSVGAGPCEGSARRASRVVGRGFWVPLPVAVAFYVALLHVSYREIISPVESYKGFTYRSPELLTYAMAITMVMAVAFVLPRRIRYPSDLFLWTLFITAGAPSILLTQYADILPVGQATLLGLHVGVCLVLLRLVSAARPHIGLPGALRATSRLVTPLCVAIVGGAFAYLAFSGILSIRSLAFNDVYDLRQAISDDYESDVVVGYILPIVYQVIGPLMMGSGIYYRRPGLLITGVVVQYAMYTSLGAKVIIFAVLAVVLVHLFFRAGQSLSSTRLLHGVTLLLAMLVSVDLLTGSTALTQFSVRRLLVVPGILTSAYIQVFDTAPKVNFAESLLPFLDSPYQRSASIIVGDYFLGDETNNASVNLWGDGYANYGFLGLYIATVALGVALWFVDDATEGLPMPIAASAMIMPAAAVGEASAFTLMLSHGLVAAVVLCAMLPRPDRRE